MDGCDDALALCVEVDALCVAEDALCIAQASLPVLALRSWIALLTCASAGGAGIEAVDTVDAYATPTCIPSASWNARRENSRRARDRTRTPAAYSIHKTLSKFGPQRKLARKRELAETKAQYDPVRRPEERPPLLVLPFTAPGRP